MSRSSDVIVVGGGVVGLSVARRLHCDGLSVTLVERGLCGAEASWAGAGLLAPCNPHRDDPLFHFQDQSLKKFPHFCEELQGSTGVDPEYERCGELSLCFTPDTFGIAKSDVRAASENVEAGCMPDYELYDAEQTHEVESLVSQDVVGSVLCRQTAQVRNPRLLRALKQSCELGGVTIREQTAVDDFIVDGDRVTGVRFGSEALSAGATILCAGAWSSGIGNRLAELMPVHPVRGQMVLMQLDRRMFTPVISSGKTYLVPRRDGHVLLGSTEEPEAGFDKRNTAAGVSGLMASALRMVPSLADAKVVGMWSGFRPGTPDGRPYIGHVPGFDGLIAATGHFRAGLTLAPATADAVSAIIGGRSADIDLPMCAPGRS